MGPSIGWLAEATEAVEEWFDALQLVWNMFEQVPGYHAIEEVRRLDADTSILLRVPHSSGLLNERVTPETELGEGDHRSHRPQEWYETGWEKVDSGRFFERDGEWTMDQAAIQYLLSFEEVASVTPTFRTTDDIDEWGAAPETPALSAEEKARVEELYEDNFGIDRDDGMDALRSSVGGAGLEDTGMKSTGD